MWIVRLVSVLWNTRDEKRLVYFLFLFFFCIVNCKKIMENSKIGDDSNRRRLVGNLLLLNGMIEQLIARNYTVLYAYKARQRLNRLFMISKFIFLYLFLYDSMRYRIILFLRNLFFFFFINQFEIVVIVSR